MKKILSILLLIIISVNLFSCRNKAEVSENEGENLQEYIDQIYAADEGGSASESKRKELNLVNASPVSSHDPTAPASLKKVFFGIEYDLTYVETLTYLISGTTVDKYVADEFGEFGNLLLFRDGSVKSLLFKFANINITGKETPQDIKSQMEAVIREVVDISKYDYCDIPEYSSDGEGFGTYYFLYYNMVNGYMTDYLKVNVKDDGRIGSLSINDLRTDRDLSNLSIDKSLEDKLLNAKTKQVYEGLYEETLNKYNYQYATYKLTSARPNICVCNGELCVQYSVTADWSDASGQIHGLGYIQRILIPLRLISNYTDNSSGTNNSDTGDTDMDANKRLESLLEQLYEGQPYEEVCEILGGPGVDTASGMIRYEWIVDSSIKVTVYFNNIIYPNNYQLVVQSFRGEIIE